MFSADLQCRYRCIGISKTDEKRLCNPVMTNSKPESQHEYLLAEQMCPNELHITNRNFRLGT